MFEMPILRTHQEILHEDIQLRQMRTTLKIAANPRILPLHVFYAKAHIQQTIMAATYTGTY
jgi:hypothetical protein